MKIVKNGIVINTKTHTKDKINEDEKLMVIGVVVPKDFQGSYCRYCPIYMDEDFTCSLTGMCPLSGVEYNE